MIASPGVKRIGIVSMLAGLLLALSASAASQAQSSSAPAVAEKSRLRILYAGYPGTDREKDFVGFLKKYFEVVRTGNLATFKEADTQGFDVTLLDWDWNDLQGPKPMVSESFSRPVVTVGVPGALICRQWKLKTGYL
jgi:opacity protein-like surface antigen